MAAFGNSRMGIGKIKDEEGRVRLAYRKFKLVYNNIRRLKKYFTRSGTDQYLFLPRKSILYIQSAERY